MRKWNIFLISSLKENNEFMLTEITKLLPDICKERFVNSVDCKFSKRTRITRLSLL